MKLCRNVPTAVENGLLQTTSVGCNGTGIEPPTLPRAPSARHVDAIARLTDFPFSRAPDKP
jgi:hypothetical protein